MSIEFNPLLYAPETEFEIDGEEDGSFIISVPIGESVDGSRVVSVDCRLTPLPEAPFGEFEFSFDISVIALDDGELPFSTQDRFEALELIPEESRPHVMETVANALMMLVTDVQPSLIYRVTKTVKIPPKAILKHELLTELLQGMEYVVAESNVDALGRRYWVMKR